MIEEKQKVVATRRDFKCPYCPRAVFETLGELGTHLSKKHGINKRKRRKIYDRMGYDEAL